MVEPRFGTLPTPGAPHELAQLVAVSRLIRDRDPNTGQLVPRELVEHQRRIARVMSERTTDGRRWRYPVVVLGLPRRTGKTVLVETLQVQRSLMYRGHTSYYTAQRLTDAWRAWKSLVGLLRDSPVLSRRISSVMSGMSTAELTWYNQSLIAPFTPGSDKALDGKNVDLLTIDEAFALSEMKAELMMQSITPTQLNRPNAQLLIVSAAGTASSTWFRSWIERGRAAVDDPDADVAIFDYGMRDGGDPFSPEEWASFHPGYGVFTDERGMKSAMAKSSKAGFLRAYCNVWPAIIGAPLYLDPTQLDALAVEPNPDPPRPVFAIDVAADGASTAIAAAWIQHTPNPETGVLEPIPVGALVEHGPGTDWAGPALVSLASTGATIIADDTGATSVVLSTIPPQTRITKATFSDLVTATQSLMLWTPTRRWRFEDNQLAGVLRDQLTQAATRPTSQGKVFDPHNAPRPIPAARAVALAVSHVAAHPPVESLVF